jgi:hypothetical protein
VALGQSVFLLGLCRMSHDQLTRLMRRLGGCSHRGRARVTGWATVTELLALPAATPDADEVRDYREKIIAFIGTLGKSNIRYRATGQVIAEPKRQRASLLASRLDRLHSAAEGFRLTDEVRTALAAFMVPPSTEETDETEAVDRAERHAWQVACTVTDRITKVYGEHRIHVLLTELLVFHSVREIPWQGETIKGTVDLLVIGDTGQGKSTQYRRLKDGIGLGHWCSGSTSSRAGLLYTLDSKINDKRILRFGAFPLAHGELLAIDEGQNISREQWSEFTTARSEGILKVDRTIRAEHPRRTRVIVTVHPDSGGFLTGQDLRRFDVLACVAVDDQTAEQIRARVETVDLLSGVDVDRLRSSVLWAWTRTADDVIYADQTVEAMHALAEGLQERFAAPEIPLLITDAHEKVARLAVAYAALLHSSNERHESVIVTPLRVALVGRLIASLYQHPNCSFDEYANHGSFPGGVSH